MSKILIVEDDPYVRKFYQRLFSLEKFEVDLAPDGEEGLEKAKLLPGLILLDIMMPGMNGLDVLKKLKEDPATKNIPVLMLTNLGDDSTVGKAAELGADGFLVKSNTAPEQLLNSVKSYIK